MPALSALGAYRQSASNRSVREREADIFRTVNVGLRSAQLGDPVAVARAVADNERLWITLMDVLGDPANQLPGEMRGALLSVGHAMRREIKASEPDLPFMIAVNDQIAAGLSGG